MIYGFFISVIKVLCDFVITVWLPDDLIENYHRALGKSNGTS